MCLCKMATKWASRNNLNEVSYWIFGLIAGVSLIASGQGEASVKKVHIIYMNHLDVGYDGIPETGFINNVLNMYFHEYYPRAAQLGKALSSGGYMETFKYTTHPWLVSMYMDCPPDLYLAGVKLKCPNSTQVDQFKSAVAAGYITWHAGPMNMQPENTNQPLWEFGLRISQDLDTRFNIKRKARVLSQRDVPGMTHAVIPSLVQMDVIGVSVGVNTATSPPAIPARIVRWAYGNHTVIGTWHPGGYPNNPGPQPSNPGGLSKEDCVVIDNFPEALCFAFRTDNSGPPMDITEVLGYYEILRKEFPGAELKASTLEDYMLAVQPIRDKLPLVTNEVGDTWIEGVGSDPRKMAEYRAVSRVLGDCVKAGACKYSDSRVYNSSRLLVKLGEHTWGLPSVGDTVHWSNPQLAEVIHTSSFKNCTLSWLEQRNMTHVAIEALRDHPVVGTIKEALKELKPEYPDLEGYMQVPYAGQEFHCGAMSLAFSMQGSITSLIFNETNWAGMDHPLSLFKYVSYSEKDFDDFSKAYDYNGGPGFTKPNSTANAHEESRSWPVALRELYVSKNGCDFYAHIQLVERRPTFWYGAPQDVWIQYVPTQAPPGINIILQLFEKTTTRLPEAIFLSFEPAPQPQHEWRMSKVGRPVDPLNVLTNGSQYQHVVDMMGVSYTRDGMAQKGGLRIFSPDVGVVCPFTVSRTATAFPFPLQPIATPVTGMAYNLYNNIWNTNYIFWYPYIEEDKDLKSRFRLEFI